MVKYCMQRVNDPSYKKYLEVRMQTRVSLTSPRYREELETITDLLYKDYNKDSIKIQKVFDDFQKLKLPITLRLAAKLALSYSLLRKIETKMCVSVVFSVFNEKNRLHRSKNHPHGENFLRVKIRQLNKLSALNPNLRWRMIIVDDGSTDGTAHIIRFILENEYPNLLKEEKVQVLFMKDAIKKKLPYLEYVKTLKNSGKGSSILYGMDQAVKTSTHQKDEKHILLYTDADLSVHLGQIGSVLYKIEGEGFAVVTGQRRLKDSVVKRPKIKSARGKLYIFLLKQIIPLLKDVTTDPQAPFKALTEQAFKSLIKLIREPGFAFDVELLILTKLLGFNTASFGIGFIDSTKASHTTDSITHFRMLKHIIAIRKRHFPRVPANPPYEKLIREMTTKEWRRLSRNIPEFIKRSNPHRLNTLVVDPKIFKAIATDRDHLIEST